jgi:hypothetical protein
MYIFITHILQMNKPINQLTWNNTQEFVELDDIQTPRCLVSRSSWL